MKLKKYDYRHYYMIPSIIYKKCPGATRNKTFTKTSLVKLFYLKWSCIRGLELKLYFVVRATHWKTYFFWIKQVLKAGQAKCPGATQNQTIFKKHTAQLFYPNWSSIKSFKWKCYFLVRGTHLKNCIILGQEGFIGWKNKMSLCDTEPDFFQETY